MINEHNDQNQELEFILWFLKKKMNSKYTVICCIFYG